MRIRPVTDVDRERWIVDEVRQALQRGGDVNAADETRWTALMVATVTRKPFTKTCSRLLVKPG